MSAPRERVQGHVAPSLVRLLLTVYLLAVARVTLWPELGDPTWFLALERLLARWHAAGVPTALDVALVEALANIVMFVPLGVLVPLVGRRRPWTTLAVGAALSIGIELTQLVALPDRVASVQDVVMNTLGAGLGVMGLLTVAPGLVGRVRVMTREPRPSLLSPSRLEPVVLDLRRVFRIGMALWAVALVVAGALALAGRVEPRPVAVCATGFVLGFAALDWERRHRR